MSTYYERAQNLITSAAARKAFDIKPEPETAARELRLHHAWASARLLARRLVEAGCRFVGVDHCGWDTHFTCFPSLEKNLIPTSTWPSAPWSATCTSAACWTARWW